MEEKCEWVIVEFDDSKIQLIPVSWVIDNGKSCLWPYDGFFKSNENFIKAVQKCIVADTLWPTYNIVSILGKYNNFDKAMKKLKKAEDQTDITTDMEKEKKNRKNRKRKFYSSDESSINDNVPTKKIKMKPLPNPPVSKIEVIKPSTSQLNESSKRSISSDEENLTKEIPKSQKVLISNPEKKPMEIKCSTYGLTSFEKRNKINNLYDEEFKRLVLSELAILKIYLKRLDDRLKNQNQNLSAVDNYNNLDDIINSKLPLKNEDSLLKLEAKLLERTFAVNLTASLCKLGGTTTDVATKFIMKKLFGDELAMKYSWSGAKGKKVMSCLTLSRVIIDAVFKIIKSTTENEIVNSIKNWLRHAKTRHENRIKKQHNHSETNLCNETGSNQDAEQYVG